MSYRHPGRLQELLRKLKKLLRPKPEPDAEPGSPGDPYAYVGAPKRPRSPNRSAAAAEPLD